MTWGNNKPVDHITESPDLKNSRKRQKKKKFTTWNRLRWLSLPFLSCIAVLFLTQQAELVHKQDQYESDTNAAMNKIETILVDEGLCPTPTCADWKTIRSAWDDSKYYSAADEALAEPTNRWAELKFEVGPTSFEFTQRVRDPSLDTFISGRLVKGELHDREVVREIGARLGRAAKRRAKQLRGKHAMPIMFDIGANIGFMTSIGLSMGARTVSFEPIRSNLGCILATVRANGWEHNSYVVHNAVSNEPSIVNMRSTNEEINLSNFAVTGARCKANEESTVIQQYGSDYMESVTIDQVMGEKFMTLPIPDYPKNNYVIDRIDVVKIDVERFEINVIEGMIRTLCHVPIDAIVLEIEYIKNHKTCKEERMHTLMKELGFTVEWDGVKMNEKKFNDLPANIVYVQQDDILGISPSKFFENDDSHFCRNIPPFI